MGRRPIWDWAIAVGVAVILVITGLSERSLLTSLDLLGYALLATSGLALVARRGAPITVLAVTGLCALGYQAVGFDVPAVAFLFAVYAAVRAGHRIVAVVGSAIVVVSLPLAIVASVGDMGEALRQAERRADEAERTREETARRRADEERLHIARELHDSLTHQISVIKVQSEAAVHVARKRGEEVPEALLVIREAGREAARELRATLEALRDDGTSPPRGLADVAGLVDRARAAGLDATLTIEGHHRNLPAAVDRTGYRIVQESLNNIARHAGAESASVRIDYQPDALIILVDDDGTATPEATPPPGVGLLGMRERVTALGGRLRAAPRRGGGFRVHAALPVEHTS